MAILNRRTFCAGQKQQWFITMCIDHEKKKDKERRSSSRHHGDTKTCVPRLLNHSSCVAVIGSVVNEFGWHGML